MKRISIVLLILFIWLVATPRPAAQQSNHKLPHYTVVDLGTLGGTFSWAYGLSDSGWVGGYATLPSDAYMRAFLWRNGAMTDLGTLGGPNSFSEGGPVNDRGNAVGAAESSVTDPLDENWCGFNDGLECLPFLWRNDVQEMVALPTLGGHNGIATGINQQDEVSGQVENAAIDPTCTGTFLQVKPVIWREGKAQELPTFPGDPDGVAWAINDWGQAAGNSGDCTLQFHILLWQNGKAMNLGSLGGVFDNLAFDINNLVQVVGQSDLPGDTTSHAFLWQWGVMTDLGTLPGDVSSVAYRINIWGQVVGLSVNASYAGRAFLWQNGVMTDLNTLIPPDSPLYLVEADTINDWGQIVGGGLQISTGELHAYLATPSYGSAESESATMATSTERPRVNLPENVRKLVERRARFAGVKGGLVTPQ